MGQRKPTNPAARAQSRTTQPGSGPNGRSGIVTKRQLDLREEAFYLHVDGYSLRAIARKMGLDRETARKYVAVETRLRQAEFEEERENRTFRSVAFNESIKRRALERAARCDRILEQIEDGTSDARINDHSLGDAIKAQERIDKVMGVEAAVKVDAGLKSLVDALDSR